MLARLSTLCLLLPVALSQDASSSPSTASISSVSHAGESGSQTSDHISVTSSSSTYSKADPSTYASWSSELHSLAQDISIPPLFPSPTATLNISIPPNLIGPIMTAVPAGVILNLIGSKYSASVRSQFDAGDPPDWYKTMDEDAKDFIEKFATALKEGKTSVFATEEAAPSQTSEGEAAETTDADDAANSLLRRDGSLMTSLLGVTGLAILFIAA